MALYRRAYDVDMGDYVVPPGGYPSFDAFFTRELKPGTRPLDPDERSVLSPADGRIEDFGVIDGDARLLVKGTQYEVGELLGDPHAAAEFENGRFAIVYLSPRDYHRVHAPVSGPVTMVRHVPGTLYPVNAIGLRHIPMLFARNERVVVMQRSERFGRVATIMVGAIGVGRISMSFDDSIITNDGSGAGLRVYGDDPPHLERGEELGIFHLGSTVILMLPPGADARLLGDGGHRVRMGEALARQEGR